MKSLRLTLKEAMTFMGAEMVGDRPLEMGRKIVQGVSVDSRSIKPGELFVALSGPNFDGHNHMVEALRKGALAVVSHLALADEWAPWGIQVPDTLYALGELAKGLRLRQQIQVVALTGSNGKTSTKEMLASIFSRKCPTLATSGNLNNLVGLPLTLFRLEKDQPVAVLEMGMNHFEEIARLAEIAQPDVGLITSVGAAHLKFFGKISEVAKAKGELYESLPPHATAVVNAEEPLLVKESRRFAGNKISFGEGGEVYLKKPRSHGLEGQSFVVYGPGAEKGREVKLALLGAHNVQNALAAAAASLAAGANWDEIVEGLELVKSFPGRLSAEQNAKGQWIIDDSYNANPSSVMAGLEFLGTLDKRAPKAAILGDMLELGRKGPAWHRQIGALAAELGLDYLALVGPLSKETAKAAVAAGLPEERVRHFEESRPAVEWLAELPKNAKIFVKGSRSMRLEDAVARLMGNF